MIVVFVVTVAVTAAALGVLYGLRGCRCRWLDQPNNEQGEP